MRDPLHWLDVKRKLALTFVGVCLLAFGVGGSLAATSASAALEEEILLRLRYQCRAWAGALDGDLRLLTRRLEDFASDGYIRESAAAAESRPGDTPVRAALQRHLVQNKLPLVPAFSEIAVLDLTGAVVATASGGPPPHGAPDPLPGAEILSGAAAGPWHSGLRAGGEAGAEPYQIVAVPLRSLDGSRALGRLVAWVPSGRWIAGALRGLDESGSPRGETLDLILADAAGAELRVPRSLLRSPGDGPAAAGDVRLAPAAVPERGAISVRVPLATNGWTATVRLHSPESLAPVTGLQSRFLLVGVALALVIGAMLLFPMRFLARPLVELREAARRLRNGELSVRVQADTEDEIGDLARSFNHMADAVETRTRRLEEAAAELAAQRDRLDAVIAAMRDGLVVLDDSGTPVLANAAAQPLVDLVAARDPRLVSHFRCDREVRPGGDEAASCASCLFDGEREARTCVVDVGARSFEVRSTPLPGPGGRRGRVLVARDVTDRLAQDEREIHQERLSVLGEVAAVMAHELNNPLAAITMFSQMAEHDSGPDSPLREHFEVIRRNAETCKRTIRELLDYATGAAPQFGDVDVHDVLRDVARFLRPVADRTGARVLLDLRAASPVVAGDEIQVRQVFVNLVVNALQAMGRKGGEVTLSTADEPDRVVVLVTDTGPGVPPDVRGRLFDPFFTTKGRGEGTGLGLSTARRIAELHGGGVELAESAPGRTVFRATLRTRPAVPGPRAAAPSAEAVTR